MFEKVAAISGIVYGLVETFKPIWDEEKRVNIGDKIAAAGFSILICLGAGVDAFPLMGLPLAIPYLGSVLTAFLIVGGGKVLHDVIGLVNTGRTAQP